MQKREITVLFALLWMLAVLAGCGKSNEGDTPVYEGGNIALYYDAEQWELCYYDAEPYPVFDLQTDGADIVFMTVENGGDVVNVFYKDSMALWSEDEIVKESKKDKMEHKGYACYESQISTKDDSFDMILYGKKQDDKVIIGWAEIPFTEEGKGNKELKDEALQILSSMAYSEKEEVGDVTTGEEYEGLTYIYDILLDSLKYGTGSGEPDTEEKSENPDDALETKKEAEEAKLFSEEEIKKLKYIETIEVEDFYGDKSTYEVYGPKESESSDGYVSWYGHGLFYNASVYSMGSNSFVYSFLDDMAGYTKESWLSEDSGYRDAEFSEMKKNGDDRYITMTAVRDDYNGVPYAEKHVYYMHIAKDGVGIYWELEMMENSADEKTERVIDELAGCYGINLDILKPTGEWKEGNEERIMEEQDIYEPDGDEIVLEKVDGYQYMGMATLSVEVSGLQAKSVVMVPMGRSTTARENSVYANMHGINIQGSIDIMFSDSLMANIKMETDSKYDSLLKDDDIKNVFRTEMMPMPGFEEAYYVIFTYKEKDYVTKKYVNKAEARCYMKLDDDFYLQYNITLSENEYDDATNVVLEELGDAYGIDLSEYYYEEVD